MKGKESTSNALAVQLDAQGKVKYDLIARQGHGKDKVNINLFIYFDTLILDCLHEILCNFTLLC